MLSHDSRIGRRLNLSDLRFLSILDTLHHSEQDREPDPPAEEFDVDVVLRSLLRGDNPNADVIAHVHLDGVAAERDAVERDEAHLILLCFSGERVHVRDHGHCDQGHHGDH